ncbi:MAG TPA: thiamine phosphate synthase, partial [Nannocystis exedens]|nr:thiamine phosphate synthase [Nannocystis exedens]
EQVRRANELPIDYLGFGPVFPTRSKVGADPSVGLDKLHRACELSERPLVAIGGLDDQSAIAARRTGADAVALISALRRPSIAQIRARVLALSDLLLATDHGSASSHGTS